MFNNTVAQRLSDNVEFSKIFVWSCKYLGVLVHLACVGYITSQSRMHLVAPNLKLETFVQIQHFDSCVTQNKSGRFLKTLYYQNTIEIDDNFGQKPRSQKRVFLAGALKQSFRNSECIMHSFDFRIRGSNLSQIQPDHGFRR